MVTLDELKAQCLKLPPDQREELAYFLLDSLEEASEEEVAAAWRAEAARRMEDFRAGRVVGIPADEVFAKLREKYKE